MYFADSDTSGNITGYFSDEFHYANGIPPTAIQITDAQWQDSVNNPGKYIVQNGAFVLAPPLTAAQQFANAKQQRLAYLATCRDNAIFATFTSSCTGTLYTYTADDRARLRYERCARKAATDTTYTGDSIYTHEAGFVAHTGPQLIQLCEDGAAHEKSEWSRYQTDATNVQNATTVDAVNAVAW